MNERQQIAAIMEQIAHEHVQQSVIRDSAGFGIAADAHMKVAVAIRAYMKSQGLQELVHEALQAVSE